MCHAYLVHLSYLALSLRNLLLLCARTTDSLICVLGSMIFGVVSVFPSFTFVGGQINLKGTLYIKTNGLLCREYCGYVTLHGVSHWFSDKLSTLGWMIGSWRWRGRNLGICLGIARAKRDVNIFRSKVQSHYFPYSAGPIVIIDETN